MITIEILLQKILKYYEVEDIEQLSKVLDVNSNILNDVIHDNNLSKFISILSEKDTDIVNDILDSSNAVQSINSLSGGNNTQTNFGAMYFNNYIIQNNNISQKIDNTSTDIYLLGLINYSKKLKQ